MTELTRRQAEVAARVARGLTTKEIAADLEISVETVRQHVREAAQRLPGPAYPRFRLALWFFSIEGGDE
jgi:DNA-binding NarL/FixJ family response regulator